MAIRFTRPPADPPQLYQALDLAFDRPVRSFRCDDTVSFGLDLFQHARDHGEALQFPLRFPKQPRG